MSKVSKPNDRFEQLLRQLLAERKAKGAPAQSQKPVKTDGNAASKRGQDSFDAPVAPTRPPRR